jgi:Ca2+-binding RTX toxin-like protein
VRLRIGSLALFASLAFAALSVVAVAHVYTASGGGGDDTMNGHEHTDFLYGNSGCDELLGRGDADHLEGGPSGCDAVRGMENGDDVIVWDDSSGGDEAYGGAGINDRCYVGTKDWYDSGSCEVVVFP